MLGLDESNGARELAIGGEDCKWVCRQEVESEPALDDACEGRYDA